MTLPLFDITDRIKARLEEHHLLRGRVLLNPDADFTFRDYIITIYNQAVDAPEPFFGTGAPYQFELQATFEVALYLQGRADEKEANLRKVLPAIVQQLPHLDTLDGTVQGVEMSDLRFDTETAGATTARLAMWTITVTYVSNARIG